MHGCLDGEEHEEPGWKSVTERESAQATRNLADVPVCNVISAHVPPSAQSWRGDCKLPPHCGRARTQRRPQWDGRHRHPRAAKHAHSAHARRSVSIAEARPRPLHAAAAWARWACHPLHRGGDSPGLPSIRALQPPQRPSFAVEVTVAAAPRLDVAKASFGKSSMPPPGDRTGLAA
jgi:hypothetical protein